MSAEKRTQNRNGTIELLRVIFCLGILLFHISMDNYGTDWRPAEWGGVLRYGALGVEFFFHNVRLLYGEEHPEAGSKA